VSRAHGKAAALGLLAVLAGAAPARGLEVLYEALLLPDHAMARVRVQVVQTDGLLESYAFDIDPDRFFEIGGPGSLESENGKVTWRPPARGGTLTYAVLVNHARDPAEYDARCTSDWALFRGEDLIPIARFRNAEGRTPKASRIHLRLRRPADWDLVSAFEVGDDGSLVVARDARATTPRGWLLAGEIERVEAEIEGMQVRIGAPEESRTSVVRDRLGFLRIVLPELRRAARSLPPRLALVSADDPMWRGGLSGPGSSYLHADLPVIDDDGTSPLLHELVHILTSAASDDGADGLVEGLAEYYAIELLERSGLTSATETARAMEIAERRSAKAESLRTESASLAQQSRGVLLMARLDAWLREQDVAKGLDTLLTHLALRDIELTPERFAELIEESTGVDPRRFLRAQAPDVFAGEAPEERRRGAAGRRRAG